MRRAPPAWGGFDPNLDDEFMLDSAPPTPVVGPQGRQPAPPFQPNRAPFGARSSVPPLSFRPGGGTVPSGGGGARSNPAPRRVVPIATLYPMDTPHYRTNVSDAITEARRLNKTLLPSAHRHPRQQYAQRADGGQPGGLIDRLRRGSRSLVFRASLAVLVVLVVLIVAGVIKTRFKKAAKGNRLAARCRRMDPDAARRTIFVSIVARGAAAEHAAGMLVGALFERARYPGRIHVGLCRTSPVDDGRSDVDREKARKQRAAGYKSRRQRPRNEGDEIKQALAEGDVFRTAHHRAYAHHGHRFVGHVRTLTEEPGAARGPANAMLLVQRHLYRGQRYYATMGVDCRPCRNWDEIALRDLDRAVIDRTQRSAAVANNAPGLQVMPGGQRRHMVVITMAPCVPEARPLGDDDDDGDDEDLENDIDMDSDEEDEDEEGGNKDDDQDDTYFERDRARQSALLARSADGATTKTTRGTDDNKTDSPASAGDDRGSKTFGGLRGWFTKRDGTRDDGRPASDRVGLAKRVSHTPRDERARRGWHEKTYFDRTRVNHIKGTRGSPPTFGAFRSWSSHGLPVVHVRSFCHRPVHPMGTPFWFSDFALCEAEPLVRHTPWDPWFEHLPLHGVVDWCIGARLWTHGWDFYSPTRMLVRRARRTRRHYAHRYPLPRRQERHERRLERKRSRTQEMRQTHTAPVQTRARPFDTANVSSAAQTTRAATHFVEGGSDEDEIETNEGESDDSDSETERSDKQMGPFFYLDRRLDGDDADASTPVVDTGTHTDTWSSARLGRQQRQRRPDKGGTESRARDGRLRAVVQRERDAAYMRAWTLLAITPDSHIDLGAYGTGTTRSLADYARRSGIDWFRRRVAAHALVGMWPTPAFFATPPLSGASETPARDEKAKIDGMRAPFEDREVVSKYGSWARFLDETDYRPDASIQW